MTAPTGNGRTPVALFAFNRPDLTEKVLERIRHYRPPILFFFVDGPRDGFPGDATLVNHTCSLIETVDWACDLRVHLSPTNKGSGIQISSGLDVVFSHVPRAIILEDDCLPDPSFFRFSDELLKHYEANPLVMSIGGHLWHVPDAAYGDSYFFSRYPATWGWATWSDRWKNYDLRIPLWNQQRQGQWLEGLLGSDPIALAYWHRIFDSVPDRADIWDYQWTHAVWSAGGLTIRPTRNLVHNIGFGSQATHTFDRQHPAAERRAQPMTFPLIHPNQITTDPDSEWLIEDSTYSGMLARQIRIARQRIHDRLRFS